MRHPLWPLFDLRLTTRDLELQHLTEGDLPAVAQALSGDVELNPLATRYDGLEPVQQRGVIVAQQYWRSLGTWAPESWALQFAVRHRGELVGTQGLEGDDFPTLRTVDSSSWLMASSRGRGWGKQMRAAVLTLAFDHLHAQYAITSAWHDNDGSLGVSRSLGYVPNGTTRMRREGRTEPAELVDDLVHLRLSRDAWQSAAARSGLGPVRVEGFDACRPFFAL